MEHLGVADLVALQASHSSLVPLSTRHNIMRVAVTCSLACLPQAATNSLGTHPTTCSPAHLPAHPSLQVQQIAESHRSFSLQSPGPNPTATQLQALLTAPAGRWTTAWAHSRN